MIRRWDDRRLDEIRSQPLEPLAERLGYRRDPRDPRRWKRAGSVLSINGPRWFDHVAQSGGGGAIDLVMHARRCGFADAVAFLAGSAGTHELRVPPHREAAWPAVRRHLAEARGLPARCLDACRSSRPRCRRRTQERGLRVHRRRTAVIGAEIVGTVKAADGSATGPWPAGRANRPEASGCRSPVRPRHRHAHRRDRRALRTPRRVPPAVILSTAGVARRVGMGRGLDAEAHPRRVRCRSGRRRSRRTHHPGRPESEQDAASGRARGLERRQGMRGRLPFQAALKNRAASKRRDRCPPNCVIEAPSICVKTRRRLLLPIARAGPSPDGPAGAGTPARCGRWRSRTAGGRRRQPPSGRGAGRPYDGTDLEGGAGVRAHGPHRRAGAAAHR